MLKRTTGPRGLLATRPAVFLDKDGTLLEDVPHNVDPSRMRFAPGAARALALLARTQLPLFVVSNQRGVALGRFAHAALGGVEAQLRRMFVGCGATLHAAYWCPHDPLGHVAPYACNCTCRKPAPGMLLRASREHGIDLARSWMVGDILDDVEAGNRAGCRAILADCGNETLWQSAPARLPYAIVADLHEAAQLIIERYEHERRVRVPTHHGAQEAALR
ncbi:D-glycero-alpha-D-manno-heptose-1,7-bisphosphate 7-phosphatase [Paraburkholderia lycopersici]|uniref:D,D-heptose 1,7-bisphosphate phosphatase n=1 Tax=Paraburkholderia lycopersici TaxID=416944 RepID=A0A1G7CB88_9BURK|nr:HAD-IIIA family hydrolase [Paraburkholderia lycopersici]SDE36634.1 histidinol-phosphate phosphatase family domain-containing protein/HAD-superfamily hydrolase, subfamily IIIA [Paraburkholderia lycopersici]